MRPFFPDVTLRRYTMSSASTGVYGETIKKPVYNDDIIVDFQNETNIQVAHDFGVELSDLYVVYMDISTTLLESDILEDDAGNLYSIIGGIQEYPKFHKYKKAHLKLRRRSKK